MLKRLLAMVAVATLFIVAASPPVSAKNSSCHGSSCNGLNPTARCDHDAITVAAMAITDGMLDLRYSPSCSANWGRYTPYERNAYGLAASGIVIHARVTAWNPEEESFDTARNAAAIYDSTWSKMTDGTKTACTGVELAYGFVDGMSVEGGNHTWKPSEKPESIGWTWGPCY